MFKAWMMAVTEKAALTLCRLSCETSPSPQNQANSYIELHRNSDHTDHRVQARLSALNLKYIDLKARK